MKFYKCKICPFQSKKTKRKNSATQDEFLENITYNEIKQQESHCEAQIKIINYEYLLSQNYQFQNFFEFMNLISNNDEFKYIIENPYYSNNYTRVHELSYYTPYIHICGKVDTLEPNELKLIQNLPEQIIEKTVPHATHKYSNKQLESEFYINKFCELMQIPGIVKFHSFSHELPDRVHKKNTNKDRPNNKSIFMEEYSCDLFEHMFPDKTTDFRYLSIKPSEEQIYQKLPTVLDIAVQISNTLKLMHKYDIVHRDIKPDNIYVNQHENKVFLADFGFSEYVPNNTIIKIRGTENYLDCTFFHNNDKTPKLAKESDVYSLGVTLWAILFNSYPYIHHDSPFNTLSLPMSYVKFLKEPFVHLLMNMINNIPSNRPTMEHCYNQILKFKLISENKIEF